MKQLQNKWLSLIGTSIALSAVLTGCGAQPQNPAAFGGVNNGIQSGWTNGWGNNGNIWNTNGSQTIMGANGQVIGYRTRQPLAQGTVRSNTPQFSHSVQVNAGDRVFVNLTNLRYGAYIRCDRNLIDSYQFKMSTTPITNATILLNGQPVGGGYGGNIQIPQSGTLTIAADLSQSDGIRCGWFGADRPFQVLGYEVSFSGGYAQGYPYMMNGAGAAVEIERCTQLNGQPMQCP